MVLNSVRRTGTAIQAYPGTGRVLVNTGTSTGILKVPVLVLFFNINISGLKIAFLKSHLQLGSLVVVTGCSHRYNPV